MRAANLQWSRCFDDHDGYGPEREDLVFWLVSAVILYRVACLSRDQLSPLDTTPVRRAIERFDIDAPHVRTTRDRIEHPASELGLFWLGSSYVRLGQSGEVEYVVDLERDHLAVENLYNDLVEFLGPLPEPSTPGPAPDEQF